MKNVKNSNGRFRVATRVRVYFQGSHLGIGRGKNHEDTKALSEDLVFDSVMTP